jgi:galactose mutarotase-like enzyme
MWNADPDVWGSHAPILFPAIGSFKNNTCKIEGKVYKIPKHGFVRNNANFKVEKRDNTNLIVSLSESKDTMEMYPFRFKLTLSFSLIGSELKVSHRVENTGNKNLPFSLGGHPGFACPLHDNEKYNDYYLEFEEHETASTTLLSPQGLITDSDKPILVNSHILRLHDHLFDQDALIFKTLKSNSVSLKSSLSNQELRLKFSDFNYLGIWAKPKANFVCIEPWIGIADHENTDGDFLKKEGSKLLPSGEDFIASYSIEVLEG